MPNNSLKNIRSNLLQIRLFTQQYPVLVEQIEYVNFEYHRKWNFGVHSAKRTSWGQSKLLKILTLVIW